MARKLDPSASVAIQEAVSQAQRRLGDTGRIVLRPSGTEPVIRVMVEGSDERLVRELAKSLAASVAQAADAA
jgi:phosphoglucosamine mutase